VPPMYLAVDELDNVIRKPNRDLACSRRDGTSLGCRMACRPSVHSGGSFAACDRLRRGARR
jgi:hypothetical protein